MSMDTNTAVLPLELVDEIICLAVQPFFGLKTHSAIALTSRRYRVHANKARFATVYIGRYNMEPLHGKETLMAPVYLKKRVSSLADLIRSGDGTRTLLPGVCGFIRSVVLRIANSVATDVFTSADFRFLLDNLARVSFLNSSFGLETSARATACSFTLGLRHPLMASPIVFKSLKDHIRSSHLDHLSLYNVIALQKGILSRSNIKHLVLYNAQRVTEVSSVVEDLDGMPDSDFEGEEKELGICPLESLETDMDFTVAEHAALFHSHSSGVGYRLPSGVVFPCLSRLKLHHKQIYTREFNLMANEMLLNAPVLEDLSVYNADHLPKLYEPERRVLPLRYSHLTRLRSFSYGSRIPTYMQIQILECLCADVPPPSFSEIILEATIEAELCDGPSAGIILGERYIRSLRLDRLDAFMRRPGFERVSKVVVRLGVNLDIYQPDRGSVEGDVIAWRDTVRNAVARQLEMKTQDLEVNIQLEL